MYSVLSEIKIVTPQNAVFGDQVYYPFLEICHFLIYLWNFVGIGKFEEIEQGQMLSFI